MMGLKRDDVVYCLIWAVTCSGVGAAFATLWNTGIKSDDVFAFAGAVVGAVGAVGGAAWLADSAMNKEKREEQADIRDEIDYLRKAAGTACGFFDGEGNHLSGWSEGIGSFYNDAQHSAGFLEEVIDHAQTISFRQRREIKLLSSSVRAYIRYYDLDDHEVYAQDTRSHHSLLMDIVKQAIVAEIAFGERPLLMMGFGRSRI